MAVVLVVDDDRAIVQAIEVILTKLGHKVVVCMDALDAAEKMDGTKFDAVISDWQMGAVTGIELLSVALQKQPSARRVLITAAPASEPEIRDAIKDDVVQIFLEKPWTLSELRGCLKGL